MRRWRMSGCNDVDNEGDRDRRCGRAVSGRGGRGTWGDRRSCSKSLADVLTGLEGTLPF